MHALRESEESARKKKPLICNAQLSQVFIKIYLNGTICINYMLNNNEPSVFKDEAGGSS